VTWIVFCAVAVVLIGFGATAQLRQQQQRGGGGGPGGREFPRPFRVAFSAGCFVVLVIIMVMSTAGTGVRVAVIAVGALACIGQFLVLEHIYGGGE
jgi:hypothetical protein